MAAAGRRWCRRRKRWRTLSEAEQLALLDLLQSYYTKVGASLQSAHQQLRTLERANQKALVAKGEISEESAAAYEGGRKLHEKLVGLCTALAELLLVALPELQETQEEKKESVKITAHELVITADDAGAFEDAETRAFYEVRRQRILLSAHCPFSVTCASRCGRRCRSCAPCSPRCRSPSRARRRLIQRMRAPRRCSKRPCHDSRMFIHVKRPTSLRRSSAATEPRTIGASSCRCAPCQELG